MDWGLLDAARAHLTAAGVASLPSRRISATGPTRYTETSRQHRISAGGWQEGSPPSQVPDAQYELGQRTSPLPPVNESSLGLEVSSGLAASTPTEAPAVKSSGTAAHSMESSKIAVVTGCSRGLGLALVSELSKNNYKVFATCRFPSSATQLNTLLTSLDQPPATQLDVTDESSLQAAYSTIRGSTGRVDLLINNAGIATKNHPVDPFLTAEVSEMCRVFATNVSGVVRTTQLFLPLLRASPRPRVINISSCVGSITQCEEVDLALGQGLGQGVGRISYRVSKAGLNMATVVMANEVPEVEFLTVHPGWVQTDMGCSGGRTPDITVAESAAGVVQLATDTRRRTGLFLDWRGNTLPW